MFTNLTFDTVNIIILIILLEIALRFYYFYRRKTLTLFIDSPLLKPDKRKSKTLLYRNSIFRSYEKKPNIKKGFFLSNNNSFGNTEDTSLVKEKNTIRIIILGGSTVEQKFNENSEVTLSWSELLEIKLKKKYPHTKFEIINSANSGYTVIDNNLDLLTKCVFFKPDFVFLYASINDAYLQPHSEFVYDYTHIRKIPNFPNMIWTECIPHLKFSYISYYISELFMLLSKKILFFKKKNLLFYTHKNNREFKSDYSNIEYPIETFKSYLRSFYGICLANKIVPIFAPWQFNEELVSNPIKYIDYEDWDTKAFINLLESNNKSICDVAKECGEERGIYLDLFKMEKDCFNSAGPKNDWQHFSSKGLEKISEDVFQKLISNDLFQNRIIKK